MSAAVTEDRGLGVAYERHVFYQRLDAWARRYGVASMLEGPIDGIRGVASVHGAGLARRGIAVTCAVENDDARAIAERVYARTGGLGKVAFRVVADPRDVASLPEADMVLVYDALDRVDDVRGYLAALAKLAKRVMIVTAKNDDTVSGRLLRAFRASPSKVDLASELAKIGQVREHVYFDAPWWPDVKTSGRAVHVYDADRWPYFGGPGWEDELLPAITKHPAFDGRSARLTKYLGHKHAFVVEKTKRRSLLVR